MEWKTGEEREGEVGDAGRIAGNERALITAN